MNVGSYTLKKMIAEGAFGRTYLAEHRLLQMKVCIKQEKTDDPDYKKLFKEEAQILSGLRHPSLPVLLDYIEDLNPDIGQLMVLSYIEGDNLERDVEKNGFIDDEHLCWIADRILGALSYLHYHSIVHSDLKPENIILDIPEHNATVVDMGMAATRPDEYSKAKGGTPFYLPPEFSLGKPPIPASDMYSLGMVLVRISGGDIRNGTLPADMHPKMQEWVSTLIRRDPTQRPSEADHMRHELGRLRKAMFGRTTTQELFKRRKKS